MTALCRVIHVIQAAGEIRPTAHTQSDDGEKTGVEDDRLHEESTAVSDTALNPQGLRRQRRVCLCCRHCAEVAETVAETLTNPAQAEQSLGSSEGQEADHVERVARVEPSPTHAQVGDQARDEARASCVRCCEYRDQSGQARCLQSPDCHCRCGMHLLMYS